MVKKPLLRSAKLMLKLPHIAPAFVLLVGLFNVTVAPACGADSSLPNPRGQISTKFVDRLADKNPLLAGAVFGVIEEHNSPCGKSPSLLGSGKLTGTMRRDRKNYTFRATGQALAQGALSFSIELEEDRTGRVQEFEGVVLENGRSGHIEQVGLKSRTSVFSWNARKEIQVVPRPLVGRGIPLPVRHHHLHGLPHDRSTLWDRSSMVASMEWCAITDLPSWFRQHLGIFFSLHFTPFRSVASLRRGVSSPAVGSSFPVPRVFSLLSAM
jgi:hypothetical protein